MNLRSFLILLALCVPACSYGTGADAAALREHVVKLTSGPGYRHIYDTAALNKTAAYIEAKFKETGLTTYRQQYQVSGRTYYNIIASAGPADAPRIIVGAHYDVCEEQQGADDNASGVAGILELARLLSVRDTKDWKYRIDMVAYTLEEPPSFRTEQMGSAVHARSLHDSMIKVKGMISVEMIGYFDDAKNSQRYPLGIFKWFYGSRGNYITLVRKFNGDKFDRQLTRRFKRSHCIRTKVFKAPLWVPGIDFSDHLNYWAYGWAALMITDTSFYRNANYHQKTDTPETLNYQKMSQVVNSLHQSLISMVI